MARPDILAGLFQNIRKIEVTILRRTLRGKKLELFNEILARKKYLQHELGPEIASLSATNYGVLKAALVAEMSAVLAARRNRDSVRERIRVLDLKASTFQAEGKVKRALAALEAGLGIAGAAEDWQEVHRMLCMKAMLLDDPDDEEVREAIANAAANVASVAGLHAVLSRGRASKRKAAETRELRLGELEDLLGRLVVCHGTKMGVLVNHARAFVHLFRARYSEAMGCLHEAHRHLVHNPLVMEDPALMDSALAVELARSSLTTQVATALEAMEGLQEFLDIAPYSNGSSARTLLFRVRWLELAHSYELKEWTTFDQLEGELLMAEEEGSTIPGINEASYTNIALMLWDQGKYRRALAWYDKAFAGRNAINTTEVFHAMALVNLCSHFSLRHWETMESHVRSIRHLLQSRTKYDAVSKALVAACLGVVREPLDRLARLQDLESSLSKLPDEDLSAGSPILPILMRWLSQEKSIQD
ncbi:MAG: tetratricopeptide repeat protein [Bacteroidia bacterium]